ncbi:MAG: hypothetical protein WAL22_10920 [Solirubrobacteraceae bacterium]
MSEDKRAEIETERAASDAARIGGDPGPEPVTDDGFPIDEAQRPLIEAGQGESQAFEQAEAELIDHASHGDQQAARRIVDDAA